MKEVILGIDIGTSSIKCNAFSLQGEELLTHTSKYDLIFPQPGSMEIDTDILWGSVVRSIKQIIELNSNKYDIVAVGICAMMIMPVLLDKNNDVVRPVIHWLDERLNRQFYKIKNTGKDKLFFQYSGSGLTGESTINALFWISENEPEVYKKISKFFMIKDYIRYKLTDHIMTDFGDASGSLMLDTRKWEWSTDLISALGLNYGLFPPLARPTDIGGYITKEASKITGLKEGTPVAVCSGDGISTIFGLGIYKNGQLGITVGSAGVIGASTNKFPHDEKQNRIYVFCHPCADRWFSMLSTAASGEVLRWYKDNMMNCKNLTFNELDLEAAKAPPGTESLIFLPYILGSRNPYSNPNATGIFLGLRHKHNQSHFTRAVLEGISFELLDLLETQREILGKSGIVTQEVRLSGGIVKSSFWPQLLSDILQQDLIITKVKELGSLGVSITTALAIGVYEDIETAVKKMIKEHKVIIHDESMKEIYHSKFSIFKDIYNTFKDKFDFINAQKP